MGVNPGQPLAATRAGRHELLGDRTMAFVALAAFGGPLALAAKYAPGAVSDVTSSGGAISIAAALAFAAPLAIWLRYARDINSTGGLTAFVEGAVGRRIAVVQAAAWIASYALYLLYTSVYVVYDLLPPVWPGVHRWRSLLAVLLPIAVAAVVVAGGRIALGVIAAFGLLQVLALVLLDVVALRHSAGASAFHVAVTHDTVHATGDVSTLFVCGSLPLFLGGGVADRRSLRRWLPVAFVLTALGVLLAVYPLARDPAFTHVEIPGLSLARVDAGHWAGVVVGIGVALSVVAVMLLEYVALARLLFFLTKRPARIWSWWIAVPVVIAGPISLIDPEKFYDKLLRPSLVALWIAQLIVVLVFPIYLARRGSLRPWHIVAVVVAVAVMGYGLKTAVAGAGGT